MTIPHLRTAREHNPEEAAPGASMTTGFISANRMVALRRRLADRRENYLASSLRLSF